MNREGSGAADDDDEEDIWRDYLSFVVVCFLLQGVYFCVIWVCTARVAMSVLMLCWFLFNGKYREPLRTSPHGTTDLPLLYMHMEVTGNYAVEPRQR